MITQIVEQRTNAFDVLLVDVCESLQLWRKPTAVYRTKSNDSYGVAYA